MALNQEQTKNNTLDLLGVEVSSAEETYTDVSNMNQFRAYDLEVGATFSGRPEVSIWTNDEVDEKGEFIKKYDSCRVRLIDSPDYLDAYFNIPKPDENGIITNVRKGFDFYRSCFDMIYSFLRYIDETNIIDPSTGEEIRTIKKINIEHFVEILNDKELIELVITEGNPDSDYNSFMIRKMVDII
jgi:hypothetical protein